MPRFLAVSPPCAVGLGGWKHAPQPCALPPFPPQRLPPASGADLLPSVSQAQATPPLATGCFLFGSLLRSRCSRKWRRPGQVLPTQLGCGSRGHCLRQVGTVCHAVPGYHVDGTCLALCPSSQFSRSSEAVQKNDRSGHNPPCWRPSQVTPEEAAPPDLTVAWSLPAAPRPHRVCLGNREKQV